MNKKTPMKLQVRATIIAVVLLASVYYLYPTIKWYTFTPEQREKKEKSRDKILNKIINLGLDLRGGIHLILELDESRLSQEHDIGDAMDRAIEIIRNRVDQFGVTEPLIVKQGEKWLVVQLPGIKDPERAKDLIGKTALLEFRLVAAPEKLANVRDKIRELEITPAEARYNPEVLSLVPTGYMLMPGRKEESLYLVKLTPELTGAYLSNARTRIGGQFGMPYVSLDFDKDGGKIFARVTETNIDKHLAIILDDVVQSAPVIRSRIPNGKAIIEGNFSEEEARFLATILRAGALPAPVKVIEERTVGPSLGEDSIRNGTTAIIIGGIIVILFMIIYYRISGIIVDSALLLNLIILMAALAAFRWTLTLPGIAGIVLTIGMAVDANVLILERIRDELSSGKTTRVAIDTGYERALTAIIDSNLTTLIAAIFLFQFGTGPIKGFAVTLTLGILISMFTAIFVTKTVYEYLFQEHLLEKIKL